MATQTMVIPSSNDTKSNSPVLADATNFRKKDMRTQMLMRPGMYIGSNKSIERKDYVFNPSTRMIEERYVSFPPGGLQVFYEVITNSADNIVRSRQKGIEVAPEGHAAIEVYMTGEVVTIRNYGEPIPIVPWVYQDGDEYIDKAPSGCDTIWVPEVIFATMFSSSNYGDDDESTLAGTNGVGIKCASVYSLYLELIVIDGFRGKKYIQRISDHMGKVELPEITDIPIGTLSSTTVSYMLDFDFFGIKGYSEEAINLFMSRVASFAFTAKAPTSFNGELFTNYHIYQYGRMFYGDGVERCAVYYYLTNPDEEIRKSKVDGKLVPTPVTKEGVPPRVVLPAIELLVADTAFNPKNKVLSFANSIMTTEGGTHTERTYDMIIPPILDKVNEVKTKEVKAKGRKGKLLDAKKKAAAKKKKAVEAPKKQLRRGDAKNHMSYILSIRVNKPIYTSQTKEKLQMELPAFPIDDKFIGKILKMNMMEDLESTLKAMKMHILTKTDGRKIKNIKLKDGFDANEAGGPDSNKCVLWIVEGKSALAYAVALLSRIPNGRDWIGIYPVRGKFMNVGKAEPESILNNPEVATLKKLLGLKEGLPYNNEENYNTLRYGKVMTMTDADKDGSHIKGLLFNFFYVLHPTLLEIGYLVDYRTKYLRASKGKEKKSFFTTSQFEDWKKEHQDLTGWSFEYFKGLGTAEEKDVVEDSANPVTIQMTTDPDTNIMFDIAFGKSRESQRKEMVRFYKESKKESFYIQQSMTFSTFFNKEFIGYVMESLDRAIPNASDGLKRCHRQILHAKNDKWGVTGSAKYKVAQFAGYIATCVEYQHNEECLSKAVIYMARDYVGANNLRLLLDRGQFGTRMFGGIDHSAPRYIFVSPTKVGLLIFRNDDAPILDYHDDDGIKVEPKAYYPIIPWALVNGFQGVGTAYSTTVLPYNPIEIVDYVLGMLNNTFSDNKRQLTPLIPWFKGYKGEVILEKDVKVVEEDEEVLLRPDDEEELDLNKAEEMEEHEIESVDKATTMVFSGKSDRVIIKGKISKSKKKNVCVVTEIPVGIPIVIYNYTLQLMQENKEIKSFIDRSTKDKVHFEVNMEGPSLNKLRLIRKVRLSNMVMLDEDGMPRRFKNVEEYMEYFFAIRYKKYIERHAWTVSDMEHKLVNLNNRIRFMTEVVEGRLEVRNRPKNDILTDMEKLGIPGAILKDIKVYDLTKEKLNKALEKKKKDEEALEVYRSTHPATIWFKELSELRAVLVADPELHRRSKASIKYTKGNDFFESIITQDPDEDDLLDV